MKVMITGVDGFIGKNLRVAIEERGDFEVLGVTHSMPQRDLARFVSQADAVVHLAGANRPRDPHEFVVDNAEFTKKLCDLLEADRGGVPVMFASSTQAANESAYGSSKRAAEGHLQRYARSSGASVGLYRLPNVFGKWSKPNYNSVVATFCHNIARGIPIRIDDPTASLTLLYIDDLVAEILRFLQAAPAGANFIEAAPTYTVTVGELASHIESFRAVRNSLIVERVGCGLARALYATYVSFLPIEDFSYGVKKHEDPRGVFVEMIKTLDSGQISFFSAHPGVVRGGHYHHTKSEKFLVVRGRALYRFRNLITDEVVEIESSGDSPLVVESIPGWAHDIKNTGQDELLVMLWANEIFDRQRPDTFAARTQPCAS